MSDRVEEEEGTETDKEEQDELRKDGEEENSEQGTHEEGGGGGEKKNNRTRRGRGIRLLLLLLLGWAKLLVADPLIGYGRNLVPGTTTFDYGLEWNILSYFKKWYGNSFRGSGPVPPSFLLVFFNWIGSFLGIWLVLVVVLCVCCCVVVLLCCVLLCCCVVLCELFV